jgi:hypothetical protein
VSVTDASGCNKTKSVVIASDNTIPHIACNSSDSSLICNQSYSYYQWYWNNDSLTGGTHDSIYSPIPASGSYYVVITDSNGCMGKSNIITILITGSNNTIDNNKIYFFPNPASNIIQVRSQNEEVRSVEIYNMMGEVVKGFTISDLRITIDIKDLASGVYMLKVRTGRGVEVSKFIKE